MEKLYTHLSVLLALFLLSIFSVATYNISRYIYERIDNYRNLDTTQIFQRKY